VAGSETTIQTFKWWYLFFSLYLEMQYKIRKEVDRILPNEDDMITLDMRDLCPYMTAFT